jgi:hypothetical protein
MEELAGPEARKRAFRSQVNLVYMLSKIDDFIHPTSKFLDYCHNLKPKSAKSKGQSAKGMAHRREAQY